MINVMRRADSLLWRVFLLLIIGVFLSVMLTRWISSIERRNELARLQTSLLAERLKRIVQQLDVATPAHLPTIWGVADRRYQPCALVPAQ